MLDLAGFEKVLNRFICNKLSSLGGDGMGVHSPTYLPH